jgi:hypothetical protein
MSVCVYVCVCVCECVSAGCRDGVNVLSTLRNKQARDLLFLPRPRAAALAALRKV